MSDFEGKGRAPDSQVLSPTDEVLHPSNTTSTTDNSPFEVASMPRTGLRRTVTGLMQIVESFTAATPGPIDLVKNASLYQRLNELEQSTESYLSIEADNAAFGCATAALELAEERLGSTHLRTVTLQKTVAELAIKLEDYPEATSSLQQAATAVEQSSEFLDYDKAQVFARLGSALYLNGKTEKAREVFSQAEQFAETALEFVICPDLCCEAITEVFNRKAEFHQQNGEGEAARLCLLNAHSTIDRCMGAGDAATRFILSQNFETNRIQQKLLQDSGNPFPSQLRALMESISTPTLSDTDRPEKTADE